MKITYDPEAEAVYIYIKERKGARMPGTIELEEDHILADKDSEGKIRIRAYLDAFRGEKYQI